VNRLKEKLLRLIHAQGPISIAQYMAMALTDPEDGYYIKRDPLGRDFITAPEVSQIFGELIGLFFVQAWEDRGRPDKFRLVELGPGRGTLMADLLRAARIRPGFGAAADITLIEASPVLREIQARTLAGTKVEWGRDLHDVPHDAPLFLFANEFFDALPIHQFIRRQGRWCERMVDADGGDLIFASAPDPVPDSIIPAHLRDAAEGAIFEASPASQAMAYDMARRISEKQGAALVIDYGHPSSSTGDTFQAVKANRFFDPLSEPGEADLTAHVDFAALGVAARNAGGYVFGPESQGSFLESLGIHARADRLRRAGPDDAAEFDSAVDRLINPLQMGMLFKVMAICDNSSPGVPGFSC
jgi:NADH dehydrogenase [ubiquinone] 1 alpha subcomplex assembly factor 7